MITRVIELIIKEKNFNTTTKALIVEDNRRQYSLGKFIHKIIIISIISKRIRSV